MSGPAATLEALVERRPDATLLLTWNFADEIVQQQAAYRQAGGRDAALLVEDHPALGHVEVHEHEAEPAPLP